MELTRETPAGVRLAVETRARHGLGIRATNIIATVVINLLLVLGVVGTAAPYVYMIASTFKPNAEIWGRPLTFYPQSLLNPALYPGEVTNVLGLSLFLENYLHLFERLPFWRWTFNSFYMAITRSILGIFLSALAGFAFAKYEFRLKRVGFMLVLLSIMLPFQVILIPLFIQMAAFGWLNTYRAIVIPFAASPFLIFLMRQYMLSVPDELLDAARIDGCTEFGLFWRVVAPIQKPAFGVSGILAFTGAWNDFLWPLIVLHENLLYTVNLGIAVLYGPYETPYGAIMAGSFLNTVPIIVVFLLLQRYFVAGLTAGALKGA
jgi:multiple sugar transport system permease protein/arabinosaccharide transport system permease protein